MYNLDMEILNLINSYIKYVYLLLGIIFLILLFKLFSLFKPMSDSIKYLGELSLDINNKTQEINLKKEKIEYTIQNSLPLFVELAFVLAVIKAVIEDIRYSKKKSVAKATIREYRRVNKQFPYKGKGEIIKTIIRK